VLRSSDDANLYENNIFSLDSASDRSSEGEMDVDAEAVLKLLHDHEALVDEDAPSENEDVDVEVNPDMLAELLQSVQSQDGEPGPFTNMLASINVSLAKKQ
jgi:hypothetical protein